MKKIFFLLAFSVVFCIAAINVVSAQSTLLYQPAVDTITNTEADTLTFSFPANRNFDYVWTLQATGLSGTDSLNVKIEESACNTCSTFLLVGSADVLGGTGTTNRVAWTSGTLYGLRQRIIITGIGTQSTKYNVYAVFRRRE